MNGYIDVCPDLDTAATLHLDGEPGLFWSRSRPRAEAIRRDPLESRRTFPVIVSDHAIGEARTVADAVNLALEWGLELAEEPLLEPCTAAGGLAWVFTLMGGDHVA